MTEKDLELEMEEKLVKDIEKILRTALEYAYDPDIHNLAYETNSEYKLFYDNLPDDVKAETEKKRRFIKPFLIAKKISHAPYHIGTLGLTKLFEKSPKKVVNSTEFTALFKFINSNLKD